MKKNERNAPAVSAAEIEDAIERAFALGKTFTVAGVMKLLGKKEEGLSDRIFRQLECDPRFFSTGDGEPAFARRDLHFHQTQFLITPDRWEIDNGILFPGHRFVGVTSGEVFPSELRLLLERRKTPLKVKTLTAPLAQVFSYHVLLGSEEVFDYFIADAEENAKIRLHPDPGEAVTLHVFDLAAFYKAHDFAPGDALLATVEDYDAGVVRLTKLSAARRKAADRRRWIDAFEDAAEKVIDRFENYFDIPEQIARIYFEDPSLLQSPAGSIDDFLRDASRIEITFHEGCAVLSKRRDPEEEILAAESEAADADLSGGEKGEPCSCGHHHNHDEGVPDDLAISRGSTGEFFTILREAGSPLTPAEVDGFILDQCARRQLEFDDFFVRAFGREKLEFADEAQQAVFLNYVEERFEELTENYNRTDDEPKAPLRETLMELVEDKLRLFDLMASLDEKRNDLPRDLFKRLAAVSIRLNDILKKLDDPAYTPETAELEALEDTLEQYADEHDAALEELTASVERLDAQSARNHD